MDLPGTPELVELIFDDELMEDPEEDPQEDLDLGEHQADHDIEDAELGASNSNFNLGEEPQDEFDPDFDPSGDY